MSVIIDLKNLGETKLTGVSIVSNSRAADTATLSFVGEVAGVAFGHEVTLKNGNEVLFHGYAVEEPEYQISATGTRGTAKLANIVSLMATVPYTEDQSLKAFILGLKDVSRSRRMVSAAAVVRHLLESGMVKPGGGAANETYEVNFDSTIRCPVGSGSQTCWGLVEDCLHWLPGVVTWYNPATRCLTLRDAATGQSIMLDITNNKATKGGNTLFTFAGFSEAAFRPRYDLQPPVVGLSWDGVVGLEDYVLPEGGDLRRPWAFRFQVPKLGGSRAIADSPAAKQEAQSATQPSMLVKGRLVPEGGWANEGNMKEKTSVGDSTWHEFWKGFSAMAPLAKTSVACLSYGRAIFEPTPVEEAFPPGDLADDNEVPENYEAFKAGSMDKLYVLYQGQFPASSKSRDNVKGLKFCKGKLKQYVWLTSAYTGELKEDEWREFFSGSHKVVLNEGAKAKNTRYALLELNAVFINRRRKKYQVGTNQLSDNDEDYEEDDSSGGTTGGVVTYDDYIQAATDYYNSTRKLFWDGSITLHGVKGYSPAMLDGANLNISSEDNIIPLDWSLMETPIVRAEYDPWRETLTLTTGSPEILNIDERVQRTLLGRQSNLNSGTSFANTPTSAGSDNGSGGTDEEDDESGFPMVSPGISAQTVVVKTSRPLNPFELYKDEDGKWYINEGTLVAPGGKAIAFETTDITEKISDNPAGFRFSVRAERVGGEWQAVIRTQKK